MKDGVCTPKDLNLKVGNGGIGYFSPPGLALGTRKVPELQWNVKESMS